MPWSRQQKGHLNHQMCHPQRRAVAATSLQQRPGTGGSGASTRRGGAWQPLQRSSSSPRSGLCRLKDGLCRLLCSMEAGESMHAWRKSRRDLAQERWQRRGHASVLCANSPCDGCVGGVTKPVSVCEKHPQKTASREPNGEPKSQELPSHAVAGSVFSAESVLRWPGGRERVSLQSGVVFTRLDTLNR